MRRVLAIIAAVLSVATGGPLRCPCQFAALVRGSPCAAEIVPPAQTVTPPVRSLCCGCKAASETERQSPAEDQPASPEPCHHGPGIDLVPPASVDRQSSDAEVKGVPYAVASGVWLMSPAHGRYGVATAPSGTDSAQPALLRYCHSFRC